jgi:acyl carrier protein
MGNVRESLRECFHAAFPAVQASALEALTPERDPIWDSLATLTLVMLVEERFGMKIPTDEIPHLLFFEALAGYVERARGQPR